MTEWKFVDSDNRVVMRTREDGVFESCLVEGIPAGSTPLPADPPDHNAILMSQINLMEQQALQNRGDRELDLVNMQDLATRQAAQLANGTTAQQILAGNIYYNKLLELDNQIRALRSDLK